MAKNKTTFPLTLRVATSILLSSACPGQLTGAPHPIDPVTGSLPFDYEIQLQARAELGGTAFNLPNGSTFNSVTVNLNNAGNVAVKVNTIGLTTSPGLWFGGHGNGMIVYDADDDAAILSDPFLNQSNQASFPRSASTSPTDDGLYLYDNNSGITTRVTNGPLGATSYTNPKINDNGLIGIRVRFNTPQALETYNLATNAFVNYVTETSGDPESRYSFLYAPAFNNNDRIAAEANIDQKPTTYKELRVWNADGTSILVASGDSNIGPVFFAMDNSISMNNLNQVAFTTRTSPAASTRRIVVGDGTTTTLFPTVSDGAGFTGIDFFAPSINDSGLVAFRGNDNQSTPRDSVFITDGITFQRIAGVGDTLMTDLGPRVVGFLMGGVSVNSVGDVAFGVQFASGSGGGNAIYVAYRTGAPTPTPTVPPTATPTATATATPSATSTVAPTPTPTATPAPSPTPDVCAWSAAPVFPIPINGQAATSLDGSLYSFGGFSNLAIIANSYKFDGTTWTAIAPLPVALSNAAAVNDGTNIYILGGSDGSATVNTLYKYDPIANSYAALAPFVTATSSHAAVYLNGKIYKVCGAEVKIFPTSALEIYNIASNTWTSGANYPVAESALSGFTDGNFIYCAGGFNPNGGGSTNKTYRYDPVTNSWNDAAIADLPATRQGAASASFNGGWILAGGSVSNAISDSAIFWNPEFNIWSDLPSMLAGRTGMNGAVLNGSLYVVGGRASGSTGETNDNQRLSCSLNPTPTPTATPDSSPTPTETPGPTSTPTPTTTPSATPLPQALNLSTRLRVETGANVGIGGFIITGSAPKRLLLRAIGPSLSDFGVLDPLADPVMELHGPTGFITLINDNWRDAQEAEIQATGIPPSNDLESAIVVTLDPGAYTAIMSGKNNTAGVGLIEVYDLNQAVPSKLANISTRAFVSTGSNVVIAGLILGGNNGNDTLVLRGIGPSLSDSGVPNALANPTLDLHNGNGTLLFSNDNWQDNPTQAAIISGAGLAPANNLESGIAATLSPGNYTAVLAGLNNTTGAGLVEVYDLGVPF